MKLVTYVKDLKCGKKTYARAVCRDSFRKGEDEIEVIKVYKVAEGVVFPNGDFIPLYDDKGRIASFKD